MGWRLWHTPEYYLDPTTVTETQWPAILLALVCSPGSVDSTELLEWVVRKCRQYGMYTGRPNVLDGVAVWGHVDLALAELRRIETRSVRFWHAARLFASHDLLEQLQLLWDRDCIRCSFNMSVVVTAAATVIPAASRVIRWVFTTVGVNMHNSMLVLSMDSLPGDAWRAAAVILGCAAEAGVDVDEMVAGAAGAQRLLQYVPIGMGATLDRSRTLVAQYLEAFLTDRLPAWIAQHENDPGLVQ